MGEDLKMLPQNQLIVFFLDLKNCSINHNVFIVKVYTQVKKLS